MKKIPCYKCLSEIKLKKATEWTKTPRYQKLEDRPRMIRYCTGSELVTYYVTAHDCKE